MLGISKFVLLPLVPFSTALYPKLLAISHISISISRLASIDDWRCSKLRSMRLERVYLELMVRLHKRCAIGVAALLVIVASWQP